MLIYAVDLGSTNIKVVLYRESGPDGGLAEVAVCRAPMAYQRTGTLVEFDPVQLVRDVLDLIGRCAASTGTAAAEHARIAITGQAESLVLVDRAGVPVAPGISWMDERATRETEEIAAQFDPLEAFAITGQPQPTPTWPATKLRWIAQHQPDWLAATHLVLMIKDYLIQALTGVAVGEMTTRGFSYLYDVQQRAYWSEMLEFCGVRAQMMPEVVAAGDDVAQVLPSIAGMLPPALSYTVNAGALDHFCAMVGSGSYQPGDVSVSAGTVLAVSKLAPQWRFDASLNVSFHPGLTPGDTVLFSCADSGGINLDWFREIAGGLGYDQLERALGARSLRDAPLFLPYLTGVNPPDFDADARGAFLGLRLRHDRIDLAYAVMEGVAHLLRRNLDDLADHGHRADAMVSAGGGTASATWNQLKADVCGLDLRAPAEPEAACRGAAMLALAGVSGADALSVPSASPERLYPAHPDPWQEQRYAAFDAAVGRLSGMDPTTFNQGVPS
ncbi:MAG: FGGY-family carbohydrate kinase [Beutenbergiaceae bacterium]